ncbi:MAG: alpha-L-arabinofuranosidase C-terminal domain-containing protein [Verrucomicrobiota bacterium]
MKSTLTLLTALLLAPLAALQAAEPARIVVDVDQPGHAVSATLYGIFFEEINHAGEGGLYAEMVLNRDFEMTTLPKGAKWAGNLLRTADDWQERKWFGNELWGWQFVAESGARGSIRLDDREPLNDRNPHSLRLTVREPGACAGVANGGFWGMNFVAGRWYDLTFQARTEGADRLDITAVLESANGRERYASAVVRDVGGAWKEYRVSLQAQAGDRCGRLTLSVNRAGTVWFDVVSLFPRVTFKDRPNGLRPDLAQALADLKPAFVRFPGGAIAGGLNLDNRIQWKNSIGPIAQRKGTMNLWGYWTSSGLGFHEYLQFCEDLGAAALWVCNPGFSDNYRHAEYAPADQVKEFVQEALDAIEYAIGPADSKWGAQRAANGHPAPFPLRYIEIGNEASGKVYGTNYLQFAKAIRARYPALMIISNQRLKDAPVEMVDDHKYGDTASFFNAYGQYDGADRNGPKIYVGEYACSRDVGEGNLTAALAEAAFLLGLERNSDVVVMSSYAPLFFHVNDIAWPVNLIGFDNARVVRRSSYHVQRMLTSNRPDIVLPTRIEPAAAPKDSDLFALAGLDRKSGEIVLKIVNRFAAPRSVTIQLNGSGPLAKKARMIALHHDDSTAENSLDDPGVIIPRETTVAIPGAEFQHTLPANSLTVLRISKQDN